MSDATRSTGQAASDAARASYGAVGTGAAAGAAPGASAVTTGHRQSPPSMLAGAARVFDLSLGEMLWSRRTIFMALIVGGPVLLAIVARIVQASGIAPLRVNG